VVSGLVRCRYIRIPNMTQQSTVQRVLIVLLILSACAGARADVDLPDLFSDHAVLQRGRPIPVWGRANADRRVTVSLNDHERTDRAGEDGRWRVDLPAMEAGGPYKLVIEGKGRTVVEDVMVGEVWVCSGQSNMEWPLRNTKGAHEREAVVNASHDRLRLFELPHMGALKPRRRLRQSVRWTLSEPKTAAGFSAVAYHFGRRLQQVLEGGSDGSKPVPVGLIQSAWGGSRAEAWTSRQALAARPELEPFLSKIGEIGASRHKPTVLYNAMIHPLVPFAVRGVIWYQGESNVHRPYTYRTLFPVMIRDWRDRWGQGDLPFYFVQLAPYDYGGNGRLPLLWEAQLMTHRLLSRTGIAVINDLGNPDDIHPRSKRPVGRRLARWALKRTYGREGVPSGPLFERLAIRGDRAVVYFRHTGDGLRTRVGTDLEQFRIAGRDRTFHNATARVKKDTVVVRSKKVEHPVAVRYAWSDVTSPNLINSEGLPASAFRTDGWAVLEK